MARNLAQKYCMVLADLSRCRAVRVGASVGLLALVSEPGALAAGSGYTRHPSAISINGVPAFDTAPEQQTLDVRVFSAAAPVGLDAAAATVVYRAEPSCRDTDELRWRLARLEREVSELRSALASRSSVAVEPKRDPEFACLLVTPFHGPFSAQSGTRLGAVAEVLRECEKVKASGCAESLVRCEETPAR